MKIKTYKTSELYTQLYGREAYEAWKRRETEIDILMASRSYNKNEIVKMREDNYRRMKAEGEGCAAKAASSKGYQAAA